jgi:multiple sugar transport system substrate-binding protein
LRVLVSNAGDRRAAAQGPQRDTRRKTPREEAVLNRLMAAGVVALLATTAACSSGSGSGGGDSAGSDEKVTLTYGLWDKNQVPAMEKIAAAFKATHPNVSVSVQVTPFDSYWTKLQAAATGGEAPDVFWMNGPNFQLYASNGVLMPDLKMDSSVYPAALVKLYQYNGKQFGVPKDFDTIGLWYNKKILDAAGIKHPTPDWTWADVRSAAKKATNPAKGVYGLGGLPAGQENFYNTIYQAGGYVISPDGKRSGYDDPNSIEGLKFWTDLIQEGTSPSMQEMSDTEPLKMFESGKLAMFYSGSWNAVELAHNANTAKSVDVAPLPAGEKKATVIHGLANVVFDRTKHPEQAKQFAEFLGSKQAADIQASTGIVIPAYNGTQQAWVKAFPQYHLQSFLDELPFAVPYPISKNTAAWNTLETDLLTKAWSGSMPVDQAARQLATEMNQELAKEGK